MFKKYTFKFLSKFRFGDKIRILTQRELDDLCAPDGGKRDFDRSRFRNERSNKFALQKTLPVKVDEERNIENYQESEVDEYKNDNDNINNSVIEYDKPEQPITHPKLIPMMKQAQIYSYDTIQLMEAIKFIDLKKQNINKIINMLSIFRRKKELKIFDFPEILSLINYLKDNLKIIQPSYLVNFFYSLSMIQNFDKDKPTLDNKSLIFEILNILTNNFPKLDIRSSSNLLFALQTLQLNNPLEYNFNDLFFNLEKPLIVKLKENLSKNKITSIDLSNIVLSYCKTQNGSEEFYLILQDILMDCKNIITPQDMSIILYSYSNNDTCSDKLLDIFEDKLSVFKNEFKMKELCNILRAYHKRDKLNENIKKLMIELFIQKHEYTNSTDISYFYKILINEKEIKFNKYINNCIHNLAFTFSGTDLNILLSRAEYMQKHNPELYQRITSQVMKLMKRKSIQGYDLREIYIHIKDIPYEGKYNIIVEEIHKYLEKIKYY